MLIAQVDNTKVESSFPSTPVNHEDVQDNSNEVEMLVREIKQSTKQSSIAALKVQMKTKLLQ